MVSLVDASCHDLSTETASLVDSSITTLPSTSTRNTSAAYL